MKPEIVPPPNSTSREHSAATSTDTSVRPELAQAELLRVTLLRQAARASRHGMPATTFHASVRIHGFDASPEDIERELRYLLDKRFIASVPNEICPPHAVYEISAGGTDLLAQYGFTE